jgi:molybdate transport system ATP-binding protein
MSLDADLHLALGTLRLEVALGATRGETVAVLGPNGAGKTTLLRALAGLAPIDRGRIALDGIVLDDGNGVFVPPERRPVGVVFQNHLLFPHLDVLENVAFGLRSRGVSKRAARTRAQVALERVALPNIGRSKPSEISGGQAQRVALARAIATEPRLLLLDEPLSALDQSARNTVRQDLRRQLASFPGVRVLVTHDPVDAAALADRLVIVEHGAVVQEGTFSDVSTRPRSKYVADLIGVNLFRGRGEHDVVRLERGAVLAAPDAGTDEVFAVVHPRAVSLFPQRPSGSPRNVSSGRVEHIELLGDRVRVRTSGEIPLVAEITPAALQELALVEGDTVWTAMKATDVAVFPA